MADGKTLEAIIANRYEVMANYAREPASAPARAELARLKAQGAQQQRQLAEHARRQALAAPRRRQDPARPRSRSWPRRVAQSPSLGKLVAMREELRPLWTRTNVSADQLVADLQAWCKKAEDSGIAALQEFSLKLRAAHA